MLKIHQLFFLNTLSLFAGTLVLASIISYYSLKSLVIEDYQRNLTQTIELLSEGLIASNNLDLFVKNIADKTDFRVTVIDHNGIVLAETDADKKKMENHSGRPEVMAAMTQKYGVAIRYSKTVQHDYIYIAKQLKTPKGDLFFRLSISLKDTMAHFYSLWLKLVGIFVIFIFIALFIAYRISIKVRHDIMQITLYLNEISEKQYKTVLKPEYFREFLHIALLLKNLVKKLRNRDKQKRKYTAKLRLVNKQQNDILSAISHEFKNPIAAIAGYTETLQDSSNISPAIQEKFLGKIHANALKISHMLDRLALSVKLENNDLSIKPTSFDLDLLCRDVTSTLQGKYPYRTIHYTGGARTVFADKTMLELVITNLIDNAIKYSEDEVTLTLTETLLSVSDKGIGIAPHELENIASKFYRVQKNRWDNSMGLGLAIVSYILKLHETTLHVDSTLGVGSTFSFSLDALHPPVKKKT